MGSPIFSSPDVPTTLKGNADGMVLDEDIVMSDGNTLKCSAVSMGNPHCITFTDKEMPEDKFLAYGEELEKSEYFPNKTNVEFINIISEDVINMKVWERGAGPTLACGTGACASVVAAVATGRLKRDKEITVKLPGGDLFITYHNDGKVTMRGGAEKSFQGEWRF